MYEIYYGSDKHYPSLKDLLYMLNAGAQKCMSDAKIVIKEAQRTPIGSLEETIAKPRFDSYTNQIKSVEELMAKCNSIYAKLGFPLSANEKKNKNIVNLENLINKDVKVSFGQAYWAISLKSSTNKSMELIKSEANKRGTFLYQYIKNGVSVEIEYDVSSMEKTFLDNKKKRSIDLSEEIMSPSQKAIDDLWGWGWNYNRQSLLMFVTQAILWKEKIKKYNTDVKKNKLYNDRLEIHATHRKFCRNSIIVNFGGDNSRTKVFYMKNENSICEDTQYNFYRNVNDGQDDYICTYSVNAIIMDLISSARLGGSPVSVQYLDANVGQLGISRFLSQFSTSAQRELFGVGSYGKRFAPLKYMITKKTDGNFGELMLVFYFAKKSGESYINKIYEYYGIGRNEFSKDVISLSQIVFLKPTKIELSPLNPVNMVQGIVSLNGIVSPNLK